MNLRGEPARVGRHCGSSLYEVTPELVDFHAEALGDESPLYAREKVAPPLLFHSECYKFLAEWYLRNLIGNLHGRQDWELFAPLRPGSRVRTRSTIVERYEKRGRDWVVNETDVMDAEEGRLLVRGRTHQSFLKARPEGEAPVVGKDAPKRKAERAPFPTAEGAELEPVTRTVDRRRCWMFSGPHANYHTDAGEARKLGFPDVVVQGMMSTCFAAQVMQAGFGMGFLAGGRLSLKLTNVLWVDETVTARARVREEVAEGPEVRVLCDVWVEKEDGTRVLLGEGSALRAP